MRRVKDAMGTEVCSVYMRDSVSDRLVFRATLGTPDFWIDGGQYIADFTAAGKALVGGNLNDDDFIDIVDFAIFVNRLGVEYDSPLPPAVPDGHTPCGWIPTPQPPGTTPWPPPCAGLLRCPGRRRLGLRRG